MNNKLTLKNIKANRAILNKSDRETLKKWAKERKAKFTWSEGEYNEQGDAMHSDQCRQGTSSKCICPPLTPKHTHKYVTGKSGTIAVCNQCSRFKHVGSGTPIVEIPATPKHTPTPLGSNNTVDDIERMLDWKDTREAVVRAVNAHDSLLTLLKQLRNYKGFIEQRSFWDAVDNAIAKAEGRHA